MQQLSFHDEWSGRFCLIWQVQMWVLTLCSCRRLESNKKTYSSKVGRVSAWSHTMTSSMIDPGFNPHQILFTGMRKRMAWPSCRPPRGWQALHQRWTCNTPLPSAKKAGLSGFENQRRHYQKSKTGYQWPNKKDLSPPNKNPKKWQLISPISLIVKNSINCCLCTHQV